MTTPTPRTAQEPAIVTLTMNPALDIAASTEEVVHSHKNRCGAPRYDPGGGGVNVARNARVLGATVSAVFPAGGPAGDLITGLLESELPVVRVPIAGSTRESFSATETSTGRQYRFVLPGPPVTFAEQGDCLNRLRATVTQLSPNGSRGTAKFVVASGSLPPNVHPDYYQRVADICDEHGARLILDTSGRGLQHITDGVFLLKPSVRELGQSVGRELPGDAEQLAAAYELIERGCAENIVVSLGEQGALLVTREFGQRYPPVTVPPGSGVGAGDAMVAGIAVGLTRGWPLAEAVRLGVATGAAMLLTPGTAPCNRADVERLFALAPAPTPLPIRR